MARRLHLGVTEIPYPYGPPRTTHEVANFLEKRYGVIEHFTEDNEKKIKEMARTQSERSARDMIKGRRVNYQPMLDEIKRTFRQYITSKSLDGRVAGVPTRASLRGVNHRLKHPYAKKNPPRPSFFDTGLYVKSFKAWVEEA